MCTVFIIEISFGQSALLFLYTLPFISIQIVECEADCLLSFISVVNKTVMSMKTFLCN